MNLFAKLFVMVMSILCLSLSVSGYLVISDAFENSYNREIRQAVNQYQTNKFILQSAMEEGGEDSLFEEDFFDRFEQTSSQFLNRTDRMAVICLDRTGGEGAGENGQVLFDTFQDKAVLEFAAAAEPDRLAYRLNTEGGDYLLMMTGCFEQGGKTIVLVTGGLINSVIELQAGMTENYGRIYLIVCVLGALLTLLMSGFFIRPVRRLTRQVIRIARGDYRARVPVGTRDEIGILGENFNRMAEAVEDSMERLRQDAVSREDFVANFAHEIKTPLTSVIGYADMICNGTLSGEDRERAARYILDEGMRLEELSFKLMDLIVLNRDRFVLEELEAREVLEYVAETLKPVLEKKKVRLELSIEEAYIRVEFDLFQTLLINLLDNAMKAEASVIRLAGRRGKGVYRITVTDNGCGMPQEELSRITEAFYMVDKSRSRRQHGAGLGLALVKRITELHGATLRFASKEGTGTRVAVTLPIRHRKKCGTAEENGAGEGGLHEKKAGR